MHEPLDFDVAVQGQCTGTEAKCQLKVSVVSAASAALAIECLTNTCVLLNDYAISAKHNQCMWWHERSQSASLSHLVIVASYNTYEILGKNDVIAIVAV